MKDPIFVAIQFEHDHKFDDAIAVLNQSLIEDPDRKDALSLRARIFKSKKRYAEAEADFRRLVFMGYEQVINMKNLADMLDAQKKFDKALKWYIRAMQSGYPDLNICMDILRIDSQNIDALLQKTELLLAAKQANSAESEIDQVLNQQANHTRALLLKGRISSMKGELSSALKYINKAIELKAGWAEAEYYKAEAYIQAGKKKEACSALNVAAETSILSGQLRQKIESLLNELYCRD